MRKFVV